MRCGARRSRMCRMSGGSCSFQSASAWRANVRRPSTNSVCSVNSVAFARSKTSRPRPSDSERCGVAFLVAEGSAIVMSLIQTGKIEAIVGVSCLSVLERAFPYMEAAAIPGVAVPLLQDDCIDTTVDLDWVWDYIHLTSDDQTRRLDLSQLRDDIDFWFTPLNLATIMGPGAAAHKQIG